MGEAIRWDLALLADLATVVERKSNTLLELRREAIRAGELGDNIINLRQAVMSAEWSRQSAAAIRSRRRLLAIAENSLAKELRAIGPIEPAGWKPELQSRPVAEIEDDLDAAFRAERTVSAAELTLELATAKLNRLLMESVPDLELVGQLQQLIDYLAYELAKVRPGPSADWLEAERVSSQIKERLDESWLRDVQRADLLAINELIMGLNPAELDAVISLLEDAHLYRWLREMDGIAGGNLEIAEEAELFRSIARKASAVTIFRLANSERGGKFHEIASAVNEVAPPQVAIEFIELCAASAAGSDHALVAALSGLAALRPDARITAYSALIQSGSADALAAATREFLKAQIIERDDPMLVEFLEGVVGSLTGVATTLWDLTGSLAIDSHQFREAWAGLGRTLALVVEDPVLFVAVVFDLETLQHNPAKWLGGATTDVATVGVSRLGRLGRLGSTAKAAAERLRRLGDRSIDIGLLEVKAGHLTTTIERLHRGATAAGVHEVIVRLNHVEDLTARLERLPGEMPRLELSAALHLVRALGEAAEAVVDEIAASLAASALPSSFPAN